MKGLLHAKDMFKHKDEQRDMFEYKALQSSQR